MSAKKQEVLTLAFAVSHEDVPNTVRVGDATYRRTESGRWVRYVDGDGKYALPGYMAALLDALAYDRAVRDKAEEQARKYLALLVSEREERDRDARAIAQMRAEIDVLRTKLRECGGDA